MRLLRRKDPTDKVGTPEAGADGAATGRPGTKGRPTPKRQRAAPPAPPPMTRKEAYARLREKTREERVEARAGMREGDDRYALARDRGPVRRLVRDVVDARRNAGSYFFGSALVIVVVTSIPGLPPVVAFAVSYLWLALIGVLFFDSFLLSRVIDRAISDRFPEEQRPLRGHKFYGIMRAATFRRLRNPKPQVKVGQTI
ncbi:MAG: DUF3043 domain-containing protein [Mycobacteriales bacterium]